MPVPLQILIAGKVRKHPVANVYALADIKRVTAFIIKNIYSICFWERSNEGLIGERMKSGRFKNSAQGFLKSVLSTCSFSF